MELEPVTFLFIVRRFYGRIFVIFNYEIFNDEFNSKFII